MNIVEAIMGKRPQPESQNAAAKVFQVAEVRDIKVIRAYIGASKNDAVTNQMAVYLDPSDSYRILKIDKISLDPLAPETRPMNRRDLKFFQECIDAVVREEMAERESA